MRKRRERRRYRRLKQKERLCIQIIESDCTSALRGKTFYCSSVDISTGGLQIELDREVPPGCVLDLWIEVKGRRGRVFLTGEVRWCTRHAERGGYQLGIEIKAGDATQAQDWKTLFSTKG